MSVKNKTKAKKSGDKWKNKLDFLNDVDEGRKKDLLEEKPEEWVDFLEIKIALIPFQFYLVFKNNENLFRRYSNI